MHNLIALIAKSSEKVTFSGHYLVEHYVLDLRSIKPILYFDLLKLELNYFQSDEVDSMGSEKSEEKKSSDALLIPAPAPSKSAWGTTGN